MTREQVHHWKNTVTLFEKAQRSTKNNYWILDLLASQYLNQGRIDEAGVLLTESLKIAPHLAQTAELVGIYVKVLGHQGYEMQNRGELEGALKI